MSLTLEATSKTILLVDDNPDDRELALMAFDALGLVQQVRIAEDGAAALTYLLETEQPGDRLSNLLPSVILLDLNLPRISGLEVLHQIRTHERTRSLPVVILTTSTEDRDLIESYSLGCNSYIRKPVDFEQFQEAIRQLGLYWLLLNQVPLPKL